MASEVIHNRRRLINEYRRSGWDAEERREKPEYLEYYKHTKMENCLYSLFLVILHLSCDEQTLQASSSFSGGGTKTPISGNTNANKLAESPTSATQSQAPNTQLASPSEELNVPNW